MIEKTWNQTAEKKELVKLEEERSEGLVWRRKMTSLNQGRGGGGS